MQASSCVSLWISILPQKALLWSDYEKLKNRECLGFFSEATVFTLLFYSGFLLEKQSFLSMSYWKNTKRCVFIELKDYILRSVTEERRFVSVYWIQVLLSRTLKLRSGQETTWHTLDKMWYNWWKIHISTENTHKLNILLPYIFVFV